MLLPLVLVAQVVLSLPFMPTDGKAMEAAGVISSAKWGMAANSSTVSLNQLRTAELVGQEVLERAFRSLERNPRRPRRHSSDGRRCAPSRGHPP